VTGQARGARTAQRVLDATLRLASEAPGRVPTIAQISARSKVSVGSIYHRFGSQRRLTLALYQRCLDRMLASITEAVVRETQAERGVRALVRTYLAFVQAHPMEARFIFAAGHTALVDEFRAELVEHAARAVSGLAAWVSSRVEEGELAALPERVYEVVLMGTAAEAARRILTGDAGLATRQAREILAERVWRSVAPELKQRRRRARRRSR